MLSKFFDSLYYKVFVNIVVTRTISNVYIELCSKKGVISNAEDNFETTSLNQEMVDFISMYTRESPYYYISVLDNSKEQGAIPTCAKNNISTFCDISNSEYKCNDGKWIYYTSKMDLYNMQKIYQEIGIDMVFSPFSIIKNFFKDKIETHLAMYLLVQEESISLSIFENSKLIFGEHIDMKSQSIEEDSLISDDMEDMELELDDEVELDEIEVDEEIENIDDLEDFADIEDLDTIEDIDEFSKTDVEEEESPEIDEVVPEIDENSFNEDYERFSFIQIALGHFYDAKKYESKFIENIYIADSIGVSSDLKHYLEEEMFLNVYIRHIDLNAEVADLARMEIEL